MLRYYIQDALTYLLYLMIGALFSVGLFYFIVRVVDTCNSDLGLWSNL